MRIPGILGTVRRRSLDIARPARAHALEQGEKIRFAAYIFALRMRASEMEDSRKKMQRLEAL